MMKKTLLVLALVLGFVGLAQGLEIDYRPSPVTCVEHALLDSLNVDKHIRVVGYITCDSLDVNHVVVDSMIAILIEATDKVKTDTLAAYSDTRITVIDTTVFQKATLFEDNVIVTGDYIPSSGAAYDVGTSTADIDSIFCDDIDVDVNAVIGKVITTEVEFAGNITLDATGAGATYVDITNSGAGAAKLYIEGAQIDSDDLSDVASIGMLDEDENVTGRWTFSDSLTMSAYTFLRKYATQAENSGIALATSDFGKTITVNAAGVQTVSLPSVAATDVGGWFTVVKLGAGQVTIDAADSDVIADSGAGDTIYNNIAAETYATITLRLVSETLWSITGAFGTWTTTD